MRKTPISPPLSNNTMTDINIVNFYANPAFNPEESALNYFSQETTDQYRVYSRDLEQTEVGVWMDPVRLIA